MANTYTQLYAHLVFAVQGRENVISTTWKEDLYRYITGIITNKKLKLLAINGMPDHIHILLGFLPSTNLSDCVRDIKASSTSWINGKKLVKGKFAWQEGFGAFTIGQSQIDKTVKYIVNQELHHKKKTFKEEYLDLLKAYDIEYNPLYLFED